MMMVGLAAIMYTFYRVNINKHNGKPNFMYFKTASVITVKSGKFKHLNKH